MNAERCVMCDAVIPEGIQVCPACVSRIVERGCPTGFITENDIRNMSELRGNQIVRLIKDYGAFVGEHGYMRFSIFDLLRRLGRLNQYRGYALRAGREWDDDA